MERSSVSSLRRVELPASLAATAQPINRTAQGQHRYCQEHQAHFEHESGHPSRGAETGGCVR